MNYTVTLNRIANVYYNLGLERAKLKDLSGAAELLKKSLHFNKYQTNSRNLLGLIYYEMGETTDALIQWVISMNLQPRMNRADVYLEEVQRKPGQLDLASQSVKKFNQALWQAQSDAKDLAILQLGRIVTEKPNFVKAQLLLALLYMEKEDHVRAGRALMKVLKTDRNNPKALVLMDEVKKRTGRAEVEKHKLDNAFSHRQMEDDDVILPDTSRSASAQQIALYLFLGVCLGLLVLLLMVLPSMRRRYQTEANQEIVRYSHDLSDRNAELSDLTEQYESLSAAYEDASTKLNAFEQQNADFLSLYQTLTGIRAAYQSGDMISAATNYIGIDPSAVTEEPLAGLWSEINTYMQNDGYSQLTTLGTDCWNASDMQTAEQYYTLATQVKPGDPEAMYLLGRVLQEGGRYDEANALFDRIIGEHPESPYADRAQVARGY